METSEGSMKLLRLTALATLFGCVVISANAQTQAAPDQGSTGAQAATPPGATEPYTIFPAKPPRFQLPTRKGSKDFRYLGQLERRYLKTPPQGDFDSGIYVRKTAPGDESCAS